ncbi:MULTISPECIES: MFS transporter [Streptomyces]|uniref:MFS transporter n=1 Tax=Streptomyces TaxID=1883 RepID=UPI00163C2911|nr:MULTISPECIES: MFS transporter [Streptomyces]MBC2878962.1 MFS transporter [Streptomyces sp. TYQ1024]UBI41358.1 MFS transporter [Streptomyces mobaraensis]UKW33857.1 MFS transporter [Streptomyces sp. TYQ1024]
MGERAAEERAEDGPPAGTRNSVVLPVFTVVTNLADGVTKVVLPLLATRLTTSPALVSAVSLALTLPWLLTALHIGVLADRADRRKLLWLADGMRLLAVGGLAATVATGRAGIAVLLGAALVLGVAEVVALTAAAALVPALVPPSRRERVNAWIAGAETAANEFGGPFVGGLLLAAGTGIALGSVWVVYAAGSGLLLLLAGRFRPVPSGPADGPRPDVHREIRDGLRFLWREPLLRTMSLTLTVLCASWGAWTALMPVVATGRMGLSAGDYGIMVSALGLGGLTGALTVTRVNRLLGRRRALLADLVTTFLMVAVPGLTGSPWAVAGAAFLGGLGGTLWTVNARLIGQHLVPGAMMGRYSGAHRLLSWGAMPLGAGAAGLLAQGFGERTAFLVFAAAVVVTVPPFLRTATPERLRKVG